MGQDAVDYQVSDIRSEAIITGSAGRQIKYPFADLEVGQVFYVYRKDDKVPGSAVRASKTYWEGKLPGRKFDVHVVSVGLRVQRIE